MKRCARCGKWKDESEFNWRWQGKERYQSLCRDCTREQKREHYEKHSEKIKEKAKVTRKASVERAEKFVYEFLSRSVCKDCGIDDLEVLTFDHVRGTKRKNISVMVKQGYSVDAIKEELTKTEVVCFNCHMRREQKKRGSGRFEKYWPKD